MIHSLDLTPRQAGRAIEQALRNHARFVIEPRALEDGEILSGVLRQRQREREHELLVVDLDTQQQTSHAAPVGDRCLSLAGSYCEVRTMLSAQLFLFSTHIVDVDFTSTPARMRLAAPGSVQVVNRRRFERTATTVTSTVRIWPSAGPPLTGQMENIGANGLAVNLPDMEADDRLLLGDEIRVQFDLAGASGRFEMSAIVCHKLLLAGRGQMQVGIEFAPRGQDVTEQQTLDRLRNVLFEMMIDLSGTEGV
jgi:hypothetical protein